MSDNVDDLAADFKYIIHGMAAAAYSKSPADLISLAVVLARCLDASRSLPRDRGALSCALEFAEAYLPQYARDRKAPDYGTPEWLMSCLPSDWIREPEEERIDGKWALSNPRWKGLPGDRSADLDVMALLRDKPGQTVKQLTGQLNVVDTTVRARLTRLEGLGIIVKSETRPERWSLQDPLPE